MNRTRTVTAMMLLAVVTTLPGCTKDRDGEPAASTASPSPVAPVSLEFPSFEAALTTLPTSAVVIAGKRSVVCFSHDGEKLWDFALPEGEAIVAPVTSAPNSASFIRTARTVFALSADGELVWTASVAAGEVPAAVALGNSTVVVTTSSNTLVNLDGDRGTSRWTFTLPEGDRITAAPRVASNSWIYVRGTARVYAVNSDGLPEWDAAL
jgi:outer membrane protein assembly factor BamB